jgi:hypothetical protein
MKNNNDKALSHDEKIAALAKMVRLDENLVRTAQLSEKRLDELFNKAAKNERFQSRYVNTAGIATFAMLFGSVVMSKEAQSYIMLPFVAVTVFYLTGSKFMDKVPAIRHEIRQRVLDRAVQQNQRTPSAP